jgi:membrane-associated phospholipid phosphatase
VNRFLERDERISERLRVAEKPGLLRTAAVLLGHSGDSWFWLAGLAIVYFTGTDYWKSRGLVLTIGIVITAVTVMAIKFTVRRKRPEGELGKIYRKTDPHSFPSGHAARAVMLAVTAMGLGPPWLGILLVIWAIAVVLARVMMGVHYLSDVLAGAFLGGLVGYLVLLITAGWV